LFDPIKGLQIGLLISPDEILDNCNNEFGGLTNNINVSWGLNHNSVISIASFIESNNDLSIIGFSNGELTFASVLSTFFVDRTLDKLV
jgi:hypothetical protein